MHGFMLGWIMALAIFTALGMNGHMTNSCAMAAKNAGWTAPVEDKK